MRRAAILLMISAFTEVGARIGYCNGQHANPVAFAALSETVDVPLLLALLNVTQDVIQCAPTPMAGPTKLHPRRGRWWGRGERGKQQTFEPGGTREGKSSST